MNRRTLVAGATLAALPWSVRRANAAVPQERDVVASPDGTLLLVSDGRQHLAVTDLDGTVRQRWDIRGPVLPGSAHFSPDGTMITWSYDSPRMLIRSDVYVARVDDGTVANLTGTDATYTGINGTPPPKVTLGSGTSGPVTDLFATFTPDSRELVFARTSSSLGRYSTTLMRIPVTGGEPQFVASVGSELMMTTGPVMWLPDQSMLVGTWESDPAGKHNALRRIDPTGRVTWLTNPATHADSAAPLVAGVSADGAYASFASTMGWARYIQDAYAGDPPFWVIDLHHPKRIANATIFAGITSDHGAMLTPLYFPPTTLRTEFTAFALTTTSEDRVHLVGTNAQRRARVLETFTRPDGHDPATSIPMSLQAVGSDRLLVGTWVDRRLVTIGQPLATPA